MGIDGHKKQRPRIAAGGFTHETSTFTPVRTSRYDFDTGYGFYRGTEILEKLRGVNVPTGGFIDAAESHNVELVPLLWTFAYSSGPTDRGTFEEIKAELLDRLEAALPLDGVLLDQHGAFVADGVDDADGDVLESVRRVVGSDCPVVAVFDMHANHTIKRVESVNALIGFDMFPHVDQAERGREALELLVRIIHGEARPTSAFVPMSLYLHPACQVSKEKPWSNTLERLWALEREPEVLTATIAMGFPFADVPDRGPSVIVVTDDDQAAADRHAEELAAWIWARRRDWLMQTVSVDEGIAKGEAADKYPIILVDQADNTGASSPGDNTEVLRTFLARGLEDALVLYMIDPEAAAAAHTAGVGSTMDIAVGGRSHPAQGPPAQMHAEVVALSDGRFRYDGPMLKDLEGDLGLSAALRQDGVTVVCVSRPMQPMDMAFVRGLGIDCTAMRYICVKAVAHFRAAFGPIAGSIISVDAAGVHTFDLSKMDFQTGRKPYFGIDER